MYICITVSTYDISVLKAIIKYYHKRQSQKVASPANNFGIGSVLNWFNKVAWPTESVDTNQQTPVYRFFPLKHSLHRTCSFVRHIKYAPGSNNGLSKITNSDLWQQMRIFKSRAMNSRNISHASTTCVTLCHRFLVTHSFAGLFGYK